MGNNEVIDEWKPLNDNDTKSIRFERKTTILLLNIIVFLIMAVDYFFRDEFQYYILSVLMLGINTMNIYTYLGLLKKGYVKIYQDRISYNTASIWGIRIIYFDEITEIIEKPNSYILMLQHNKKMKIWNATIKKNKKSLILKRWRQL